MDKKRSAGKIAGIIFCIAAICGTAALFWLGHYLGGQMKTVDKYCTALERDDFSSYAECFLSTPEESGFETAKALAERLDDPEDFRVDADFVSREKLSDGKYSITYNLTVYNDSGHEKIENVTRTLIRQDGGWVFETEEFV